jgi:solute carrier family 10 (sodium/bile acid cotransporter), member 7
MVAWKPAAKRVQAFVITYYLPLAFAVAVIWAMAWPSPGKAVASVVILDDVHLIQEINMVIVFFISGLVLKTEDIKAAMKYKLGCLYGLVSILFLTPLLAFGLIEIPLSPPEYAAGRVLEL